MLVFENCQNRLKIAGLVMQICIRVIGWQQQMVYYVLQHPQTVSYITFILLNEPNKVVYHLPFSTRKWPKTITSIAVVI